MRPFIKWVGGKARLVPSLLPFVGSAPITRYFEPFLGGGALFFALHDRIGEARLSDSNSQLIGLYCDVAEFFRELQEEVDELRGVDYYELRAKYNLAKLSGDPDTSALLLALLSLCFNGLYRENRVGKMNTPIGRDSKGRPYSLDRIDWYHIERCAHALRKVHGITSGDWKKAVEAWEPRPGDLYFFDPPYLEQFSDYSGAGFSYVDHLALGQKARELGELGARVIVTGSSYDVNRGPYGEPTVYVQSTGTFGVGERSKIQECIWVYGPERK